MEKHPKRPIYAVNPGDHQNMDLEPVIIAGVAFFLDHVNEMVIPMEPVALPSED